MPSDQILFYLLIIGIGALIGFAILAGILRFLFGLLKGLFGFGRFLPGYGGGYGYAPTEPAPEETDSRPLISAGNIAVLLVIGYLAVNISTGTPAADSGINTTYEPAPRETPTQQPATQRAVTPRPAPAVLPEVKTPDDLTEFEAEAEEVPSRPRDGYCLQLGSFEAKYRADRKAQSLRSTGHSRATVRVRNGYFCTVISGFATAAAARAYAERYDYKPIVWSSEEE
ncbi:SPOR domain-containing protein [Lewinella sp. W8]|uniref:SPOR domain-containing protein n=1 Tax=Lewinella sp. W8 TaxID=2528208 RepID=UPI001068A540|nr:SPOR domain-containing protein [Lewinella sp. W8]MTB51109.1 hypothetical protein [Lewinella sp. W8]